MSNRALMTAIVLFLFACICGAGRFWTEATILFASLGIVVGLAPREAW